MRRCGGLHTTRNDKVAPSAWSSCGHRARWKWRELRPRIFPGSSFRSAVLEGTAREPRSELGGVPNVPVDFEVMNVVVRRSLLAALVAAPSLLGSPGCAENESTIFIRQVNVPVSSGNGCTVEPTPTSLFISRGLLDLAFRNQYVATLLVGNQLVARGNPTQERTET